MEELKISFSTSSGTSYSAPQISGVCAIILQTFKKATPGHVKFILKNSADEITLGVSANGVEATKMGPTHNKGIGMVNIKKAILLAKALNNVQATKPALLFNLNVLSLKWGIDLNSVEVNV
ncbi:MAG: S8 family serine peptidase [Bacteroidetes bacterium]|nr:S8 family serine peptidase [Bacteroidota bacterium]